MKKTLKNNRIGINLSDQARQRKAEGEKAYYPSIFSMSDKFVEHDTPLKPEHIILIILAMSSIPLAVASQKKQPLLTANSSPTTPNQPIGNTCRTYLNTSHIKESEHAPSVATYPLAQKPMLLGVQQDQTKPTSISKKNARKKIARASNKNNIPKKNINFENQMVNAKNEMVQEEIIKLFDKIQIIIKKIKNQLIEEITNSTLYLKEEYNENTDNLIKEIELNYNEFFEKIKQDFIQNKMPTFAEIAYFTDWQAELNNIYRETGFAAAHLKTTLREKFLDQNLLETQEIDKKIAHLIQTSDFCYQQLFAQIIWFNHFYANYQQIFLKELQDQEENNIVISFKHSRHKLNQYVINKYQREGRIIANKHKKIIIQLIEENKNIDEMILLNIKKFFLNECALLVNNINKKVLLVFPEVEPDYHVGELRKKNTFFNYQNNLVPNLEETYENALARFEIPFREKIIHLKENIELAAKHLRGGLWAQELQQRNAYLQSDQYKAYKNYYDLKNYILHFAHYYFNNFYHINYISDDECMIMIEYLNATDKNIQLYKEAVIDFANHPGIFDAHKYEQIYHEWETRYLNQQTKLINTMTKKIEAVKKSMDDLPLIIFFIVSMAIFFGVIIAKLFSQKKPENSAMNAAILPNDHLKSVSNIINHKSKNIKNNKTKYAKQQLSATGDNFKKYKKRKRKLVVNPKESSAAEKINNENHLSAIHQLRCRLEKLKLQHFQQDQSLRDKAKNLLITADRSYLTIKRKANSLEFAFENDPYNCFEEFCDRINDKINQLASLSSHMNWDIDILIINKEFTEYENKIDNRRAILINKLQKLINAVEKTPVRAKSLNTKYHTKHTKQLKTRSKKNSAKSNLTNDRVNSIPPQEQDKAGQTIKIQKKWRHDTEKSTNYDLNNISYTNKSIGETCPLTPSSESIKIEHVVNDVVTIDESTSKSPSLHDEEKIEFDLAKKEGGDAISSQDIVVSKHYPRLFSLRQKPRAYLSKTTLNRRIIELFRLITYDFNDFFPKQENEINSLEVEIGRRLFLYIFQKICNYYKKDDKRINALRNIICHHIELLNENQELYYFACIFKEEYRKAGNEVYPCLKALIAAIEKSEFMNLTINKYFERREFNIKPKRDKIILLSELVMPELEKEDKKIKLKTTLAREIELLAIIFIEKIYPIIQQTESFTEALQYILKSHQYIYYTCEFILISINELLTNLKINIDNDYINEFDDYLDFQLRDVRNSLMHELGSLKLLPMGNFLKIIFPKIINFLNEQNIQLDHHVILPFLELIETSSLNQGKKYSQHGI